jgi:hypothetical protein
MPTNRMAGATCAPVDVELRLQIAGFAARQAFDKRRRATVVIKSLDLEPAVDRPLGDVCKPFRQASEGGLP